MGKNFVALVVLGAGALLGGCASNNNLSDAEVERERARANEVHREMERETR